MVERYYFSKTKLFLKRAAFLAVALLVIANLLLGNIAFAKKMEITDKEVEEIKTGLDIFKLFANITVTDDNLKTILNTVIKGGQVSTDVTYGLFVLSAMNEMELIDMVVSQRYKTEARAYFNSILDEKLNLISYWKGIGFDLPRVISGNITGPMSALTLNTFAITDQAISIFTAFNVLRQEKLYDGLWRYFDSRKGNESHETAWEDAKIEMGFAAQPTSFLKSGTRNENNDKLELQFATLWDKWGPYVTPYGIAKEAKEQMKSELRDTLVSAIESQKFVEKESKPSLTEKIKSSWDNLIVQLKGINNFVKNAGQQIKTETQSALNAIKSTLSKINPFLPAALVDTPKSEGEEVVEQEPENDEVVALKSQLVQPEEEITLGEMQEMLDDVAERIDVMNQEVVQLNEDKKDSEVESLELEKIVKETEKIKETEELEEQKELEEQEEIEENEEIAQIKKKEITLCKKTGEPVSNKVVFNEIAWMGSENSANNEWIELKNISGSSINLTGWQILDKDEQIKIIFSDENYRGATPVILPEGVLLLERSNDDSVPGKAANLIYTGGLNNTNEALYLFDENCRLMDEILANPDWPAGDNISKRTMERRTDLGWQTSANSEGTPKGGNSSGYVEIVSGGGSPPPPSSPPAGPTLCSQENLSPAAYQPVIINEIAWMGSVSSSADEWVELKNISTATVSLNNWQIIGVNTQNNENNIEIFLLDQNLSASAIFLLERTNDDSVPGIPADKIFTGSVNDSEFILRLFDQNCILIDEVQATSTWPAGQKTPERRTLERANNLSWYTSLVASSINGLFGTPKAENSQLGETPPAENQPPTAVFTFTPENPTSNQEIIFDAFSSFDQDGTITSYLWDFGDSQAITTNQATTTHSYLTSGVEYMVSLQVVDNEGANSSLATTTITVTTPAVIINEIAWMGTSATNSADEWIELYNNTSAEIDLNNWTLTWSHGTTTHSFAFSTSTGSTTISAQGFYLLERSNGSTTSMAENQIFTGALDNDGEKLELRNADSNLIDLVDCSSGWFAGTTSPAYISMERIRPSVSGTGPQNWANNNLITRNGLGAGGNAINGTPKDENSVSKLETQVSSLPFSEFEGLILTYFGSPYIVTNTLTIPQSKTLTVESGTTLKFSRRQGLVVNGTLLAKGKENKKITFNSLSDSSYWGQIYFTSQGQGSVLENCLVKNAGQIVGNLAIMVDSTSINIKDSKIENTTVEVLRLINSSSTIENLTIEKNTTGKAIEISGGAPEIKNSKIIGTYAGIFIEGGSRAILEGNYFEGIDYPQGVVFIDGAYPVLKNNSGALNSLNGIYLYGTVSNDWVLYKNEIPYVIDYLEVAAGKTLEIEAGTTIQIVPPSAYSGAGRMEINGTLKAIGTENNKIIFTVLTPGSRWDTIRFNSQEATSILKYVDIQYGGKSSAPTKGALSVENAKVEFQYLSFNGNYYSLYFKNSFLATISDLEFTNCFRGILFEDGCPPMNNLSLNCTCNFASPAISCSTTSESICP